MKTEKIISSFSASIGEVLETYGNIAEDGIFSIADFQSKLLAIYNKKENNKGEIAGLKDGNLYQIRSTETLDSVIASNNITAEEIKKAREEVDRKSGLNNNIPGFAAIGKTLGYITEENKNLLLETQAYVKCLDHLKKAENEKDKQTEDQKETGISEVVSKKIYSRVNNERDSDSLRLAQIIMVLGDCIYWDSCKNKQENIFEKDYKEKLTQIVLTKIEETSSKLKKEGLESAGKNLEELKKDYKKNNYFSNPENEVFSENLFKKHDITKLSGALNLYKSISKESSSELQK